MGDANFSFIIHDRNLKTICCPFTGTTCIISAVLQHVARSGPK